MMISDDADEVLEAIPLDIEQAFVAWWNDPGRTSGVLCPEDEVTAYVAFAAGVEFGRGAAEGATRADSCARIRPRGGEAGNGLPPGSQPGPVNEDPTPPRA